VDIIKQKLFNRIKFETVFFFSKFFADSSRKFFVCFQVLVALDNGSLELLSLSFNNDDPEKPYHFLERLKTIQEHDDIITGMTLTCDGTKVVTSSYDK
jgi:hypothetical protein